MKRLLRDLEKDIPMIGNSISTALGNIKISQMSDRSLWNFNDLKADGRKEQSSGLDHFSGMPLGE